MCGGEQAAAAAESRACVVLCPAAAAGSRLGDQTDAVELCETTVPADLPASCGAGKPKDAAAPPARSKGEGTRPQARQRPDVPKPPPLDSYSVRNRPPRPSTQRAAASRKRSQLCAAVRAAGRPRQRVSPSRNLTSSCERAGQQQRLRWATRPAGASRHRSRPSRLATTSPRRSTRAARRCVQQQCDRPCLASAGRAERPAPAPQFTNGQYYGGFIGGQYAQYPAAQAPPIPPQFGGPRPVPTQEYQKTATVKNPVNLKKHTISLTPVPDQPHILSISFTFDADEPCRRGLSVAPALPLVLAAYRQSGRDRCTAAAAGAAAGAAAAARPLPPLAWQRHASLHPPACPAGSARS